MNKLYGKFVDGKFVGARPVREELPDGRGFIVKFLSDEDLASGEYKEVVSPGDFPSNYEVLLKAGVITVTYEDVGNYIVRKWTRVTKKTI